MGENSVSWESRFQKQSYWAAILTFELIVLGSLVRASNAGLACPDWPKCYGLWVPAMDWPIFLEWFHRLVAGLLGLVVMALIWSLFRSRRLWQTYKVAILCSAGLFVWQCILGGLTVLKLLEPGVVTWHLANALLFFGVILWMATRENLPNIESKNKGLWNSFSISILVQLILGAAVSTRHAGLACPDFPTCQGMWLPQAETPWPMALHMLHRVIALYLVLLGFVLAYKERGLFKRRALSLFTLLVVQGLLGWAAIRYELPVPLSVLHFANAMVILSVAWVTTFQSKPLKKEISVENSSIWRSLFQMTKPTITLLVVVTTIPGLLLALEPGELPTLSLLWGALLGAGLTSASAAVFNQVVEMDVDRLMMRTCGRSLPKGAVSKNTGVFFGLVLLVMGEWCLWYFATPLAAAVALFGHLFYVLIYTMILKKRTVQNIVIGGAAGAVGPLIGWAAVTGQLSWEAWAMFVVIFLWTPPHFWSLAIKYMEDYRQAGIPMYPVVHGEAKTRRLIFLYTASLIPVVVYLAYVTGPLFLLFGGGLTVVFAWKAWKLWTEPANNELMPFFHYSCFYTFGVFGVMTIERLMTGVL